MAFEEKKYLDYEGLQKYDALIKSLIDANKKEAADAVSALKEALGLEEGSENDTVLSRLVVLENAIGDVSELGEDVENLVKALIGEATRAAEAEGALSNRLDAVEPKVDNLEEIVNGKDAVGEEGEEGYKPAVLGLVDKVDSIDDALNAEDGLASRLESLEEVMGDAESGFVKDLEDVSDKLDTLLGDDADKSVREIAIEALAAQLIPEDAQESLDTLEEIAAWIQAHPEDAAAMNVAIASLENKVGKAGAEEVSHEATEEDVEAGLAENVGDKVVDKEAEAATGFYKEIANLDKLTDARLDAVEIALGMKEDGAEGDKSIAEKVADLELADEELQNAINEEATNRALADSVLEDKIAEVDEKLDAYVRISNDEIDFLFLKEVKPEEGQSVQDAIDNLEAGEKLVLANDVAEDLSIPASAVVDANGNTFSGEVEVAEGAHILNATFAKPVVIK